MSISLYLRRGMAWAPIWIPVFALHLWAVWIIWTVEPTVPGVLNSGDDPVLFTACLIVAPAVCAVMGAILYLLFQILRRAWQWSRERDRQVVTQEIMKSYRGPGK